VIGESAAIDLAATGTGTTGMLLVDGGVATGGGGKGAIPIVFAAAAAAEAYFRASPGGLVGNEAGFMLLLAVPLPIVAKGVCSVASAGRGDLSCVEGRLADAEGGSAAEDFVGFVTGILPDRVSISATSSCIDCVS